MFEQKHVLRWEKPRDSITGSTRPMSGRRSQWDPVAQELRDNPGVPGVVQETDRTTGLAYQIRRGHLACFRPAGDFDAVTRLLGGTWVTYAWYVGDSEAPDA